MSSSSSPTLTTRLTIESGFSCNPITPIKPALMNKACSSSTLSAAHHNHHQLRLTATMSKPDTKVHSTLAKNTRQITMTAAKQMATSLTCT